MKESVLNLSENINNEVSLRLYALTRNNKNNPVEKYELRFAQIEGSAKVEVLEIIKKFLNNKNSDMDNIISFFNFDEDYSPCYEIDSAKIPGFENLINLMSQYMNLKALRSLDIKVDSIVLEIIRGGDRFLFFQRINPKKEITKGGLNMVLSDGSFNRVIDSKSRLELRPYFDFVYMSNKNKFLIFDKNKFENTFDFREIYNDATKTLIEILRGKNVVVNQELATALLSNKHLAIKKKITNLHFGKIFENLDVSILEMTKGIYSEFNINLEIIDGKLHIRDEKNLKNILIVLSESCVKEAAAGTKFIAKSKKRIEA
ncbi:DUF4868 domain-containing protein [Candidatus Pacearchaeota archaeon]|nr:DUF4868 domain-containing protein [Candidatus Pacearchaeota archaeon]